MPSFGEELRRERELRQITLREIAEATKINIRYLDALERNDFTHLPGGVFNKGFVRAYAEFIGIDPETMVNAYLLEERGQEGPAERGRSPAPPEAPRARRPARDDARSPRSWVLAFVLILFVAGVLACLVVLWYRRQGADESFPATESGRARPCAIVTEGRG